MQRGILTNMAQRTKKVFHTKPKGQTSLIMILVLAMAFIFYAISLNWGRMASLKTTTWVTATNAASQTASLFASYGERTMWEGLLLRFGGDITYSGKGDLEYQENTWLIIKLIVIVIVVVILCALQQYWAAGIVGGLMFTALIIDYAVIRPMMFNMWNKLQQNMQTIDQFRETGIGVGIQGLSTDSVEVPDRFDANGNGKWGFNTTKPNDVASRFSLYYTERLKMIKPPDNTPYEGFQKGLKNLISFSFNKQGGTDPNGLGFNPLCTEKNKLAPQCDPMCTGMSNRPAQQNNSFGFSRIVSNNSQIYVPRQCTVPCVGYSCPPGVTDRGYFLLYDNSLEMAPPTNPYIPDAANPENQDNSFRFRLGHDDEVGKENGAQNRPPEPDYKPSNARGIVFPMLAQIDDLETDKALSTLSGLSSAVTNAGVKTTIDPVVSKNDVYHFKAPITSCAQNFDSSVGFNWKKGADRYCAGMLSDPAYAKGFQSLSPVNKQSAYTTRQWPYYQCTYMYDSSGNPVACSEGDATSNKNGYISPQDNLDGFVYDLSDLIKFNTYLQHLKTDELVSSVDSWYPRAAEYIAPQCSVDACKEFISDCQSRCTSTDTTCKDRCDKSCKGMDYNNPATELDKLAQSLTAYTLNADGSRNYTFAYNTKSCNPKQHGAMIRWIYNLKNWIKLLNDPKDATKGWLNESFTTNAQSNLCTGTLSYIVNDCLKKKKVYTDELNACQKVFPSTTTKPDGTILYPKMPKECTAVIYKAQRESTEFFTSLSGVPAAPADAAVVYPTADMTKEAYEAIQTWLNDNVILKNAVTKRYDHLNSLYKNATGTVALFQEGVDDFTGFLSASGPAAALMNARANQTMRLKRLPAFVIYGWKDNNIHALDKTKQIGSWHLARMELVQPDHTPEIHTWEDIDFGWDGIEVISHYQYRFGYGKVYTRTTRWDESMAGGLANFANKIPIWRFKYNNPHPSTYNPTAPDADAKKLAQEAADNASTNAQAAINQYCTGVDSGGNVLAGLPVFGKGIGLTQDTKIALQQDFSNINPLKKYPNNPPLSVKSDEAKAYREAFMLNLDPRMTVPKDVPYTGSCGEGNCKTGNWSSCCSSTSGYWGSYWKTYCQSHNKNACLQNAKNKEIAAVVKDTAQCFYAANALLNQGVKSTAGAEFWVPPLSKENKKYHEKIDFLSSKDVDDAKKFDDSNTLLDTDLYK